MTEMPRESGSSTGRARATASSVPATATQRRPSAATLGRPKTGRQRTYVRDARARLSASTKCDADSAARDVKRTGIKRVHQAIGAEEDVFVRGIVEEHGNDSVGTKLSFCPVCRRRLPLREAGVPMRPSVRFHTLSSWPAASSRSAMGVPIWPVPKNPIFIVFTPHTILSLKRSTTASATWDAR